VNSLQMFAGRQHSDFGPQTPGTVYRVNGKTGEIIWRMGGKKSDFQVEPRGPVGLAAPRDDGEQHRDDVVRQLDHEGRRRRAALLLSVDDRRDGPCR